MPKTYVLDTILRGYNSRSKLRDIYKDLRESILPFPPTQTSDEPLLTLQDPNWRRGNYGWELYLLPQSAVMVEYFGVWRGYPHETPNPPAPKDAEIHKLKLTIHNSNPDLEKEIESIIDKYPRNPEKKSG